MRLYSRASNKFLPLALSAAITAAITGCNSGSSSDNSSNNTPAPTPAARVSVPVTASFTATYKSQVDHNQVTANSNKNTPKPQARELTYYEGTLTATNTTTGESENFDWPVTADETGKVTSEKTVTVEPGTYDFTLVVTKGSQQYTSVMTGEVIEDQGEYRLNMDIFPVVGNTIINIDSVKNLSRLQLSFPANELANIGTPQIGLIIDGVETIYELNKENGLADVVLNLPEGTHAYDVNLYDANTLIGRSKLGEQNLDLVEGDDLNIDIISLQADITVDFGDGQQPKFIVNIPEEVITDVGDMNNLKLLVRITDGDSEGDPVQEATLDVQQDGERYYVEHIFDETTNNDISTYIEFLDMTSGSAETIATCSDSVTVHTTNTMSCGVGIPKDYIIGGNLLATLAINVLDTNKVAQSGASVYLNNTLVGVTGSNFGTGGFIKAHVTAGELYTAVAKKDELEGTHELTPNSLSINNFDIILENNAPTPNGATCQEILTASGGTATSGLYQLDVDGAGPLNGFETWCDMETKGGGWTLVQNRQDNLELETTNDLMGPIIDNGSSAFYSERAGAISDLAWNHLKTISSEVQVYSGTMGFTPQYFYTTIAQIEALPQSCASWGDNTSLLVNSIIHHELSGCSATGGDYAFFGIYLDDRKAQMDNTNNLLWQEGLTTSQGPNAVVSAIYLR